MLYQFLPPMLLNEFQRQQRVIEAQTATLATQAERIAELEKDRQMQTARIDMLERQSAEIVALKKQVAEIARVRRQARVSEAMVEVAGRH